MFGLTNIKMPVVQPDWDFGLNLDSPYLSEGLDLFESLNISPLEEFWKTELDPLSDTWNHQEDLWNLDCKRGSSMIRVHDCMWAGTCVSKDHVGTKSSQGSESRSSSSSSCTVLSSIGSENSRSNPIKIPAAKSSVQTSTPSPRSLIKKSIPAPIKILHRPDTPQSEDDMSKTPDDHDLSWSMGVAVSEITGQRRTESTNLSAPRSTAYAVSCDHNYNTQPVPDNKQKTRLDDLGVQTPSDSEEDEEETEEEESQSSEVDNEEEDEEEEIDVVSVKPSSPPRKKMADRKMQEEWHRREQLRLEERRRQERIKKEQEWRLSELSQQEQNAVKYASQNISKRLNENNRGRGRQKRKRTSSDEEDLSKIESYIKSEIYKPNYRRSNVGRPRTTTRRKYTTPSKKTRISTDSETDSTEKRSQHNNMERMRRIDLRNSFEDLRSLVPSLTDAARAAKVTILRDAASYCLQLTANSKTLQSQVSILRKEQEKLRSNLSKLRRHIAIKHAGPSAR